ncbi:cyclophilin-like fold protein [Halorussus halobius]|uniref:cyclophilin-like fold protein n=1 Tax=Halorussus halobius TaxID=1710537 RepID=UPI0010928B36|nr:cyclophilin-like fold protein [Halorussus halobius]
MSDLAVTVAGRELTASWVEENPETRAALADALPVAGEAAKWGDELYFDVPVDASPENTREAVPVGAIAYWPPGNALCLFWGPTPASVGDEPRAASGVAVVAEIEDVSPLAGVTAGAHVRVAGE